MRANGPDRPDWRAAPGRPAGGGADAAELVGRNIDRVLSIEDRAVRSRSAADTVSETLGGFVGTLWFAAAHVVAIALWVLVNTGRLGILARPFDPYPFNLLSTIVSSEAVVLSAFVLMKQNRMSHVAERRDHLDLQVNLLAEQEASLIIQMLERIGAKLGIDERLREEAMVLSRTETLDHLTRELHRRLPDCGGGAPSAPPPG